MIERYIRDVAALHETSVNPGDRTLAGHQALERVASKDEDDLRLDQLQLTLGVGRASLGFVGHWVAVHRRAALEHVGDVHVRPAQTDACEKRVEQLAGGAY